MKALLPILLVLGGCASLTGTTKRLPEDVAPLCSPFFSNLPARPAKEKTPGLQEKFQAYLDAGAHSSVLGAARNCWASHLVKNDSSTEAILCVRTRFKDGKIVENTVGTHGDFAAPQEVIDCAQQAIPRKLRNAPVESVEVDVNQTVTLTLNR